MSEKLIISHCVGLAIKPERVRLNPMYKGTIENDILIGGARELSVGLGPTTLRVLSGFEDSVAPGTCGLDIDPHSIQVWTLE